MLFGVVMYINMCRFAMWYCESYYNDFMNIAWGLYCGGSRSTKICVCVFPCKVAAVGDERYLLCAAVAGAVVSSVHAFLLRFLQRVAVILWVF